MRAASGRSARPFASAGCGSHLMPHLSILGSRGIPAQHGGFETLAEHLATSWRDRGWTVTVYRQVEGKGLLYEDDWNGIRRVNIPVRGRGAGGTIMFDRIAMQDVRRFSGPILTLGYNTGPLCFFLRRPGRTHFVNMDGHEWGRRKYGMLKRLYLRFAERAAARYGDHLIADHPEIAKHLARYVAPEKITTLTYGADAIESGDERLLEDFGVLPGRFFTLIARPEPDNSVLEIVRAFSSKRRDVKLVVLGDYDAPIRYRADVRAAASEGVIFPGAIYDKPILAALRFHSIGYLHGHQVGGTNPSLVEALGAGNPVIARDNHFNRWVAGDSALYFSDIESCAAQIDSLIDDGALRSRLSHAARARWDEAFRWDGVLGAYQALLTSLPAPERTRWWRPWRPVAHTVKAPSLTPSSA